jgi:hypothetical protein
MPVVAMNMLWRRAGMRYDDREIAKVDFIAEQRTEQFEQARIREYVRAAEGAGHAQRDIAARTPDRKKPIRRRPLGLGSHGGFVQGSELREILLMHRFDSGGWKHATEQHTAVLTDGGMSRGLGGGRKLAVGPLARGNLDNPIHRQLLRKQRRRR